MLQKILTETEKVCSNLGNLGFSLKSRDQKKLANLQKEQNLVMLEKSLAETEQVWWHAANSVSTYKNVIKYLASLKNSKILTCSKKACQRQKKSAGTQGILSPPTKITWRKSVVKLGNFGFALKNFTRFRIFPLELSRFSRDRK